MTAAPRVLVVHCRRAPFDVYIGRPGLWGNPFSHVSAPNTIAVPTREEAIRRFERYLRLNPKLIALARRTLHGKVLGCWCKPLACHGDILARVANE